MAKYKNSFDKTAGFYNTYREKLINCKTDAEFEKFWEEIIYLGKLFDKDDTEQKLFVLVVDSLEVIYRSIQARK